MTRDLILVASSLLIWGVGEGMFIFFQAINLQRYGANPILIGTILGAMGVAMALAQIPAGYLADRKGRRPVMWASWFTGTVAAWVMALATSLEWFITGMMLYGLTSFVLAPMNSYITGARGRWSVGRALTLTSAAFNLGAVIGPAVGGWIGDRYGLNRVYLCAAVLFMISTAVILFVRRQAVLVHTEEEKDRHLLHNTRFIGYLAVIFVAILAITLPQPLTQNFLQNEKGYSLTQIGRLGALGSLGSAVLTLGFGRLNAGLAFLVGQGLVAAFSLIMWRGQGMGWYGLAYFVLGGYRLCRSMTVAQARPLIRPAEIGLAYGIIETVNSAAYILAPVLAGLLYNRSPELVYPASLGLIGLSLAVSGVFIYRNWHTHAELTRRAELSSD